MKYLLIILVFFFSKDVFGQLENAETLRRRQYVLEQGIVDSTFIFGNWQPSHGIETQIKYLGKAKSLDNRTFKILTSCWIWGASKRATNRILIYNNRNEYLGSYFIEMKDELPVKIKDNVLIFEVLQGKQKLATEVDLSHGLPIFIYINGGSHTKFG